MKMYDITVKTYLSAGVHGACGGYATYRLEVKAEDKMEAQWIALQVADPECDRGSCVAAISELEGI